MSRGGGLSRGDGAEQRGGLSRGDRGGEQPGTECLHPGDRAEGTGLSRGDGAEQRGGGLSRGDADGGVGSEQRVCSRDVLVQNTY